MSVSKTLVFIRAKVRELSNEVSKKTSFIDEMELKYSSSSECGTSQPAASVLLRSDLLTPPVSQLREWTSWRTP